MPLALRVVSNAVRLFLGILVFLLLVLAVDSRGRGLWTESTDLRLEVTENGDVIGVSFEGREPTEEDIEFLSSTATLRRVNLRGARIDEDVMDALSKQSRLESLSLAESSITDEQLSQLPDLSKLIHLDLSHTKQLSRGLSVLPNASSLLELSLSGCPWLNDEQLPQLKRFPNLAFLTIEDADVTDNVAAPLLANLQSLKRLTLRRTPHLRDDTLAGLGFLNRLTMTGASLTLQGLKEFRSVHPNVDLIVDYADFAELSPIYMAGGDISEHSFLIRDDDGLDYSILDPLVDEIHSLRITGSRVDDRIVPVVCRMKNLKSLDFSGTSVSDAVLDAIPLEAPAEHLTLAGTRVTDNGLARVGRLPMLRTLDLSETGVTDSGVQSLSSLVMLSRLDLSGTKIVGDCLPSLNAGELVHLNLSRTGITDEALLPMQDWKRLHWLILADTAVTGAGLKNISMTRDSSLDLSGTSVSDDSVHELATIRGLGELLLAGTSVSGETLADLASCGVRSLDVSRTILTDAGCAAICKLPGLRMLTIRETQVSESGLQVICRGPIEGLGFDVADAGWKSLEQSPMAGKMMWLALHNATDADLAVIERFPVLAEITLQDSELGKSGIERLSRVRNLRSVTFRQCRLQDGCLTSFHIPEGQLTQMILRDTPYALAELRSLKNLNSGLDLMIQAGMVN
jgi:Leucine-rich repeat (LRR) protein